jgi:Mn-dependent DtxR family transcriptional regulator
MGPTPSMEDYLERIVQLMQEKGYARVVDIAQLLKVQSPSVTRMVQKLAEEGFLEYEKYRGIVLTEKGEALGRAVKGRHKVLAEFLRLIGVEDESTVFTDVEGIEHHVSPATMEAIRSLVHFFQEHATCLDELRAFQARRRAGGDGTAPGAGPAPAPRPRPEA